MRNGIAIYQKIFNADHALHRLQGTFRQMFPNAASFHLALQRSQPYGVPAFLPDLTGGAPGMIPADDSWTR